MSDESIVEPFQVMPLELAILQVPDLFQHFPSRLEHDDDVSDSDSLEAIKAACKVRLGHCVFAVQRDGPVSGVRFRLEARRCES